MDLLREIWGRGALYGAGENFDLNQNRTSEIKGDEGL
jgi:hypothetical protein